MVVTPTLLFLLTWLVPQAPFIEKVRPGRKIASSPLATLSTRHQVPNFCIDNTLDVVLRISPPSLLLEHLAHCFLCLP